MLTDSGVYTVKAPTPTESTPLPRVEGAFIHWNRPEPPAHDLPLETMLTGLEQTHLRSAKWRGWKHHQIESFIAWAHEHGLTHAGQIDRHAVAAYMDFISAPDSQGRMRTAETLRKIKTILSQGIAAALPASFENPFDFLTVESRVGDRIYNREPLTPNEVSILLDAASEDPFTYDLVVTGLCTGLRRGDVCHLRWESVDLSANTLRLVTSKTQTALFLPILPLFRTVLLRRFTRRMPGECFVFPAAARMLDTNPSGITWRIKKAFTLAFYRQAYTGGIRRWSRQHLTEHLAAVIAAVERSALDPGKQRAVVALLYAYSERRSLAELGHWLGISRGTRTNYLRLAEKLSGVHFLPEGIKRLRSVTAALGEVTRVHRTVGVYSASKYDFHALRTSFVTLAINGGISIDKLRAITGHQTVDMVLRHYFKPKGTDVANDLRRALPAVLTGYRGRPHDRVARILDDIQSLVPADRDRLLHQLVIDNLGVDTDKLTNQDAEVLPKC